MTKESMIYFPEMVIKNLIKFDGYIDRAIIDNKINEIVNCREYLELITELMYCIADYKPREIGTMNDMAIGARTSWYDFASIKAPALIIHGTHDAEVKFYHGVFAYEQLASTEKSAFGLSTAHFGFTLRAKQMRLNKNFRSLL